MKIKLSVLLLAFSVLCVTAYAQNMNTISYVPVKNGYYDKISTKSTTALAQDIGDVYMETLKANSSDFILDSRKLTLGKPVFVRDSVFTKEGSNTVVTGKLIIDGSAQMSGTAYAQKVSGVSAIHATQLLMPLKKLNVGSASIYVDGVEIPQPGCTLEWRTVTATDTSGSSGSYPLLYCQGSAGGGGSSECSGECTPGATQSCGSGGTKTCSSSCTWGACGGNCSSPKTKWDSANLRCVCPGSYDYYHAGTCCSYQTPKTDTRCWGRKCSSEFKWTSQGPFEKTIQRSYIPSMSEFTSGLSSCSSSYIANNSCQPPASSGEACVKDYNVVSVSGGYKATYSLLVCLPVETCLENQALWDPATEKNY